MMNNPTLITVPTFTFNQGDILKGDFFETPIQVDFYDGTIVIRQDGEYTKQEEIKIHPKFLKSFCRAIVALEKEANEYREFQDKKQTTP